MLRFLSSDPEISAHAEPKFAAPSGDRPESFTSRSRRKVGLFGSILQLSTSRRLSLFIAVSMSSKLEETVEKLARNPPAR